MVSNKKRFFEQSLGKYTKLIYEALDKGDATEETFYSYLKNFLENVAPLFGKSSIKITTQPKKTEAGVPDFRVWDGVSEIVGYIEAKYPGKNLDYIEQSDQLRRYREVFPNLILTDFYEFRLYRNGVEIARAQIGRPFVVQKLKKQPPIQQIDEFIELLEQFFSFSLPRSFDAKRLSVELAKRTRFLRDHVIIEELKQKARGKGTLWGLYEAFKEYLIKELDEKLFADLFAQTITYGLFAARMRSNNLNFNRQNAVNFIPNTIGILKTLFKYISVGNLPKHMEVVIDDIAQVLKVVDVKNLIEQYRREGKGDDPIAHFYETFLAEYDPGERERRGVYYTPQPVVNYIVRSIHKLLKSRFDLMDGLANNSVTLLDPAAGTLTFPATAIELAVKEHEKYGSGAIEGFIRNHILKHFYAFELMLAPYAIGHIRIGFLLNELGYQISGGERIQLYLTNTLDDKEVRATAMPILSELSEENREANRIKKSIPILVIFGNPPYQGISANINDWTEKLLKTDIDGVQSYYKVDGNPLEEKNPKWLQDDYVKFLRFAQWKIHKTGYGIVGMITNHGYLDNPTFRGMRQSLLKTFDEIYILNLHGNTLKKETPPDGGKDENVFDIKQGVAIGLFIKTGQKSENDYARVFYTDLWGTRDSKYIWLNEHDVENTEFVKVTPGKPYYFFVPKEIEHIKHYLEWPKINEIFPVNSVGIVTARDKFVIDFDREALKRRISQFLNPNIPDEFLAMTYNLKDKSNWQLSRTRSKLMKEVKSIDAHIYQILYRPFDVRYIFYRPELIERPRFEVMRHMLAGENLGLIIPKRVEISGDWRHVFVTNKIIEHVAVSLKTIDYLFPLYLYPEAGKSMDELKFEHRPAERQPNIANWVFEKLEAEFGSKPTPEEIFYYIYAVFYSNIYREKYAEYLRVDFPRVPFTSDYELFKKMAAFGKRLVDLHLLKSPELDPPIARYEGEGSDTIERVKYDPETCRVYINKTRYFEGIPEEVWEYRIGGYQVLKKYLNYRKGHKMDDPRHYILIATAIERTIAIQKEIDSIYLAIDMM